jgi:hypothetical protein
MYIHVGGGGIIDAPWGGAVSWCYYYRCGGGFTMVGVYGMMGHIR